MTARFKPYNFRKMNKDPKSINDKEHTENLHHPASPAEKQKGNSYPEHLHNTVKPVPDPIPGESEKIDEPGAGQKDNPMDPSGNDPASVTPSSDKSGQRGG